MTSATVSTLALGTLSTGIVMVESFSTVHEAAETLVGHPIWTHEFPSMKARLTELIKAQLPDFPTEASVDNWQQVRDDLLARYGETIEIERGTDERTESPIDTAARAMAEAKAKAGPDLTGWTPHDGTPKLPTDLIGGPHIVPLFRGTEEQGPHEGGPTCALMLNWGWNAATNFEPDPMDVLTGKAPLQPSADIIAWRYPNAEATPYPHVRADLGQ